MAIKTRAIIGYRGKAGAWKGVLKLDGKVVWECPHFHRNRDQSTTFHTSACDCAAADLDKLHAASQIVRRMAGADNAK